MATGQDNTGLRDLISRNHSRKEAVEYNFTISESEGRGFKKKKGGGGAFVSNILMFAINESLKNEAQTITDYITRQ